MVTTTLKDDTGMVPSLAIGVRALPQVETVANLVALVIPSRGPLISEALRQPLLLTSSKPLALAKFVLALSGMLAFACPIIVTFTAPVSFAFAIAAFPGVVIAFSGVVVGIRARPTSAPSAGLARRTIQISQRQEGNY